MVDQNAIYTFRKRGVFYFSRRVPKSLQPRFDQARVVTCLHTRSLPQARKSANALASQLEMVWAQMALEGVLKRSGAPFVAATQVHRTSAEPAIKLSEAGDLYRQLKGKGKGRGFNAYAERHLNYVVECLGDALIGDLKRSDSGRFRDFLIARRLTTSSIKRVFSTVRAAVNLAISEHGLDCANPFSGTFIPEVGVKVVRPPIPASVIRSVQHTCLELGDDKRLLLALISDTGLRLAEALGLAKADLKLQATVPHIDLKPHPWRSLKTPSSTRTVPLVGTSLIAAHRLTEMARGKRLFVCYSTPTEVNANSASATLNKWLRPRLPKGCVIHSFRHSIRDRLRAIECPADIIDAIGGWTTQGIGHRYGSGHSLEVKQRWLKLIEL